MHHRALLARWIKGYIELLGECRGHKGRDEKPARRYFFMAFSPWGFYRPAAMRAATRLSLHASSSR